jgi:hypothetical protein
MTQIIRTYCDIGLREAKDYTDLVMDGKTVTLYISNHQDIQQCLQELIQIGAIASIIEPKV